MDTVLVDEIMDMDTIDHGQIYSAVIPSASEGSGMGIGNPYACNGNGNLMN